MKTYSKNFKEALVKKALLQSDISPRRFAKEAGVSNSALYNWIQRYKSGDGFEGVTKNGSNDWTTEDRFNMLIESGSLTEEQRGAYCRRKGIFQHQLLEWKKEFMKPRKEVKDTQAQAELKLLRSENKGLKKDLRRKEKALAETSALLILKKKADLIWGGIEED